MQEKILKIIKKNTNQAIKKCLSTIDYFCLK